MPGEVQFRYSIHIHPRSIAEGGGYIAITPDWPNGIEVPPPTATGTTAVEALMALEAAMTEWLMTPGLIKRPPPDLRVVPKVDPNR